MKIRLHLEGTACGTGHRPMLLPIPVFLVSLLAACAGGGPGGFGKDAAPDGDIDLSAIHDAHPRWEPRSRYGNPPHYEVNGRRYVTLTSSGGYVERGIASWYGTKFHGRRTSSGEIYNLYGMTAAHKTLPLPTYAKVTNLKNDKSVVVRINDRGPFHSNRIIDLSYAAAAKLGILEEGTGIVEVRAIDTQSPAAAEDAVVTTQTTSGARAIPVAVTGSPTGVSDVQERTVPADPQPQADTNMYLQVGAFRSRENAEKFRRQLAEDGLGNIRVVAGESEIGDIFRVWIGPFGDVQTLDRTSESLVARGIKGSHVIID
jgi:rare lipoprotein A